MRVYSLQKHYPSSSSFMFLPQNLNILLAKVQLSVINYFNIYCAFLLKYANEELG